MAISLIATYPGKVAPATGAYPFGQPRNITVPGDGTGTPREASEMSDVWGFLQFLLTAAGIVPSGTADTAITSQYAQSLAIIHLNRSELRGTAGDVEGAIIQFSDRYPVLHITGCGHRRLSNIEGQVVGGSVRTFNDNYDLDVPAVGINKFINSVWDETTGGRAPSAPTIDEIYAVIVIGSADGLKVNVVYDTSPTGANFFGTAEAITAGYTNPQRFRRVAWIPTDASNLFLQTHVNLASQRVYDFHTAILAPASIEASRLQRAINTGTAVIPGLVIARMQFNWQCFTTTVGQSVLISSEDEVDIPVTSVINSILGAQDESHQFYKEVKLSASAQYFARDDHTSGTSPVLSATFQGWIDNCLLD